MLKVNVSDAIVTQTPPFITGEFPKFNEFVQEYYRYLEQQSKELGVLREVRDNIDIDRTETEFLEKLKKFVLPVSVDNTTPIISDEELIKVLRELYLNKGTEDSLIFIMKKLFGNDSSIDYGRKYVLRPSDNEYVGLSEIIIKNTDANTNDLLNLQGSTIVQGNAYAIIDSVSMIVPPFAKATITGTFVDSSTIVQVSDASDIKVGDILESETFLQESSIVESIDGLLITISKLPIKSSIGSVNINVKTPYYKCVLNKKTIRNEFEEGVAVTKFFINNVPTFLDVIVTSNITNFDIIYPGSLYSTGQAISLLGGDGYNASIIVDEISSGKVEDVIVVDSGTKYRVGDEFEVRSLNEYGTGARVAVEAIDGYGAELEPVLGVNSVTINKQLLNYAIGDIFELDGPDDYMNKIPPGSAEYLITYDRPTYEVTGVAGGTVGDYNWVPSVVKEGSKYPINSKILIKDGVTEVELAPIFTTEKGISSLTFDNFVPNTTWIAPVIMINGSGAYGEVTIVSKEIDTITQTSAGDNYVNPLIRLYTTNSYTTEIVGSHPSWSYFDVNNDIDLNIVGSFKGYFDVPDGTYYYRIDEITGSGCELSIDNLSYVTTFTSLYDGYFINEVVSENIRVIPVTGLGHEGSANVDYKLIACNVINPGINYLAPVIEINDEDGSLIAEANISNESVISDIKVLDTGLGYFNATLSVRGDGSGFIGTPILSETIEKIKVIDGGSGYTTATVTINGDGIGATADATITGSINSITVTDGGSGYTTATVTIIGDGTGATATATIVGNVITGINVTDGGAGYSTATVTITGNGIDATAVATIIGEITSYTITNKGSGYTDATVSIVGDGAGASATAIGGKILGITITDGGINWKNALIDVLSVDTVNTTRGSGAKLKPIITPKTGILNVTILP